MVEQSKLLDELDKEVTYKDIQDAIKFEEDRKDDEVSKLKQRLSRFIGEQSFTGKELRDMRKSLRDDNTMSDRCEPRLDYILEKVIEKRERNL
jgi:hypothetical protein